MLSMSDLLTLKARFRGGSFFNGFFGYGNQGGGTGEGFLYLSRSSKACPLAEVNRGH
jgi:hypothetical protein